MRITKNNGCLNDSNHALGDIIDCTTDGRIIVLNKYSPLALNLLWKTINNKNIGRNRWDQSIINKYCKLHSK